MAQHEGLYQDQTAWKSAVVATFGVLALTSCGNEKVSGVGIDMPGPTPIVTVTQEKTVTVTPGATTTTESSPTSYAPPPPYTPTTTFEASNPPYSPTDGKPYDPFFSRPHTTTEVLSDANNPASVVKGKELKKDEGVELDCMLVTANGLYYRISTKPRTGLFVETNRLVNERTRVDGSGYPSYDEHARLCLDSAKPKSPPTAVPYSR